MGGPVVSTNEREFVVEALRQGIRADGRSPFDFRTLDIRLGLDDASGERLRIVPGPPARFAGALPR